MHRLELQMQDCGIHLRWFQKAWDQFGVDLCRFDDAMQLRDSALQLGELYSNCRQVRLNMYKVLYCNGFGFELLVERQNGTQLHTVLKYESV